MNRDGMMPAVPLRNGQYCADRGVHAIIYVILVRRRAP